MKKTLEELLREREAIRSTEGCTPNYNRLSAAISYARNPAKGRETMKKWRLDNPSYKKAAADRARERYAVDPKKAMERSAKWAKTNPGYFRAYRESRIYYKIKCRLDHAVRRWITRMPSDESRGRKPKYTCEDICGCSEGKLREHLGEVGILHLDHIRPSSAWDLLDPKQLREAYHWSNLRLVTREENARKGSSFSM